MRRLATALVVGAASLTLIATSAQAVAVDISVDKSFSGDGVASLNVRGDEFSFSVVPDGDHYYLVGGTRKDSKADCAFLVARYDNRGRLDSTFGQGGEKTLTVGNDSCATGATMAANGDLLVSGWSVGREVEASVVALRPNGSLRRSFGRDGIVRIRTSGGVSSPSVEVEPDGSIWLAWPVIRNWNSYRGNYQVAHLRPNGSRDTSFGDRGVRTFNVRDVDAISETAVDSTGRLLVAGWSSPSLKANGSTAVISVDEGEPTHLRTFNPWGRKGSSPISADVDANDLLVVGLTPYSVPGWGAMRVTGDLRLNKSYSGDGYAMHDCRCFSHAGVLTADGVVLVGATQERGDNRTVVVHFGANGAWDADAARFGPWQAIDGWEYWQSAAIDSAGRMVMVGQGKNRTRDAIIGRLTLS